MIDLRHELRDLHAELSRSGLDEGGRVFMFISAKAGEGTSSIAASSGLIAAEMARKPVWLVELDVMRNHLFNSFAVGDLSRRFGGVGRPYQAYLKNNPFFSIEPENEDGALPPELFTAHRVGDTRMMVTQFASDQLKPGQSVRIRARPDYWAAVRAATDWAVVDAPSLERSAAGLAVASQVDGVVLVVKADETSPDEVDGLRRKVEHHGGKILGVVMNRMGSDAVFVDGLAR